jgi:membrane associated rhomboid family serine protease
MINIGRKHLSLAGFIRVYSLGAIGGGFIRLSLFWLFGEEGFVIVGANLAILTLLGALVVLETDRVTIFGDVPGLRSILIIVWLLLMVFPTLFISNGIAGFLLSILPDGFVFILALFRMRLMRIAVVWLLADLIIWLWWEFRPDIFLADVAALGLGMGYVLVERLGRKFEARAQTAS